MGRPILAAFLALILAVPSNGGVKTEQHGFKALVFSKTAGFRHQSIAAGISAFQQLAVEHSFTVEATEDASVFVDSTLAGYDVVVFLNTTGDVLNAAQQEAFERYIQTGGGFVGVHSAADTEYDWSFYGGLVGAYFGGHPEIQSATVLVSDRVHPSTEALPERWGRTDEWYNYATNPRGQVHVLATLDETTYSGGTMAADHPIAWCQLYEGGRSWYTGGGHTEASYSEAEFRNHLVNGLEWAAGVIDGDCNATVDSSWEKVVLDDETNNPMDLAVASNGDVYFIQLGGEVKVYRPSLGSTVLIENLDVFASNEHGLMGIALDPDFDLNGWIYLFYSPSGSSSQRLSRFTVSGDALTSETTILEFPTTRNECCHAAGSMEFDGQGNLFIATGDDANPFDSNGYTPIDERPGRQAWDAQRSSANTDDLRGKILRITPQADGSYSIPADNLFPSDGSAGRPEIFAMGLRNPFRISVDRQNGWVYWGDVGPDAGGPDANRGPAGHDEWNQARTAGNYGWPYCIGDNFPYRDYNFDTSQSGSLFDCNSPVNDSPNNSGATNLPAAIPAWIWYPYGPSSEFPQITNGSGRTAMAGPVVRFNAADTSETRIPEFFDNSVLIYEWSRNWVKHVKLDDQGDILTINPFLDGIELRRPIVMKLSPAGDLYAIEWGTGFGGNNNDSQLIRLNYQPNRGTPVAVLDASATSGPLPLLVEFDAQQSYDPDSGNALSYEWDLDGDGSMDATGPAASYTYTVAGQYLARLTVTDTDGNFGVATVTITAGNTSPVVSISRPVNGGFFDWGDTIAYDVSVVDAEDGSTENGTISCSAVTVQVAIGHDDHSHPLDTFNDCTGEFKVISGHGDSGDNLFYVVTVSYTDAGGAAGSLTGSETYVLRPKKTESEHFDSESGVEVEQTGDNQGGGSNIGFIDDGDYTRFNNLNLANIDFVTFRVASAGPGGRIEIRVGSPTGPMIGLAHVEPTGQWQLYREVTAPVDDPGGENDILFVYRNESASGGLFNINWMDFHGRGVGAPTDRGTEGLEAVYFDGLDFTGSSYSRIDPRINFNWSTDQPIDQVGSDSYSVRWTGSIQSFVTEPHRFYARSSDGMRVWVDDELIIDVWEDRNTTETFSDLIPLDSNRRYDLVVEYYEATGAAQAHLSWSSFSVEKSIVPSEALFPEPAPISIEETPINSLVVGELFPNPASGVLNVGITSSTALDAQLQIFDLLGRRVVPAFRRPLNQGHQFLQVDTSGLTAGLYFLLFQAGSQSLRRRFIVTR